MSLGHWLRILLKKFLTSLLWEMKNTDKTLVVFFSFLIKTFFTGSLTSVLRTLVSISLILIPISSLHMTKVCSCRHRILSIRKLLLLLLLLLHIDSSRRLGNQYLYPSLFHPKLTGKDPNKNKCYANPSPSLGQLEYQR